MHDDRPGVFYHGMPFRFQIAKSAIAHGFARPFDQTRARRRKTNDQTRRRHRDAR